MFKIEKTRKINWPITINVPQDGGETKEQQFTAQFELISQKEYDAFYAEESAEKDIGLARRVLTGWGDDVFDEDGNHLEFNDENREKLIAIPYVRNGIVRSYIWCMHGNKAAAAKN
ncbi:MAG: hypothetical protein HRU77_06405 [Gammaproteobacteria bacterium]|nr:MAG: hypothetical protein HRU77_06405 [Gammaproteobacteria bacterium]